MQEGPDQTAHPSNLIGAIIHHFMTRVTNKIVPHRKRSFAFIRVLVSLNVDDKYNTRTTCLKFSGRGM